MAKKKPAAQRPARTDERAPAPSAAQRRTDRRTIAVAAVVGCTALAVYVATAARDIVAGDTPELVAVAATLGVAHPPGYPLLTLLGHFATLLPFDPLPFRVNLLSAACAAGTVALVFLTSQRLLRDRMFPAAGALLFAFTPLFWSWSLVTEVFPLNSLLAAAMGYCLLRWRERPDRAPWLVASAGAAGLGLANQQTIALLLPSAAWLLWSRRQALLTKGRALAPAAAALLLPLLLYAYLPWAAGHHQLFSWGELSSASDLLGHLLRRDYGTGQLVADPGLRGGSAFARVLALVASYGPVLGPLVVLGAVDVYRRHRDEFWYFAAAFAFSGVAFVAYANADISVPTAEYLFARFFLLPQVVTAPLAALGLAFVAERMTRLGRALARPVVAAAGAALAAVLLLTGYDATDQSANRVARNFAEDILTTLEPRAILIAAGDHVVLPVLYLQAVEGRRPDVTLVILPLLRADWYVRQLAARDPQLVFPPVRFDRPEALATFVGANRGRPIAMSGEEPGATLFGVYGIYPRGLTLPIVPAGQKLDLAAVVADNERLLESYRTPRLEEIKPKTFDRLILAYYALPAYRLGRQYETARLFVEARAWYDRALRVDPELPEAREALARLPR